jgi:hypothetical protein
MSTEQIEAPAIGATWFNLARHDDPEPDDTTSTGPADEEPESPDADDQAGTDDTDDSGATDGDDEPDSDGLGDAGKKALDRMKADRAAAKKEAAAAKKAAAEERRKTADLARKVQEFEDRDRSDLEKAQAKADRAAEQATKAVARSVKSEIKASAVGKFADTSDAVDVLMRDPSKFVDADGEVDTDAIEAELADLLDRKPHWAVPESAPAAEADTPRKPRPRADPAQGSRGPVPPTDFRNATKDELAAELGKYGYRQRSA